MSIWAQRVSQTQDMRLRKRAPGRFYNFFFKQMCSQSQTLSALVMWVLWGVSIFNLFWLLWLNLFSTGCSGQCLCVGVPAECWDWDIKHRTDLNTGYKTKSDVCIVSLYLNTRAPTVNDRNECFSAGSLLKPVFQFIFNGSAQYCWFLLVYLKTHILPFL